MRVRIGPPIGLSIAMFWLAGCAGGQTDFEVSQTATSGVPGFAEEALVAAGQQFLGDDGFAPVRAAPQARQTRGGGGGSIDFSPDASTPYNEKVGQISAVSVVRRDRIGGVGLRSTVSLEHSDKRVVLPEGIGILTDPMTVSLSANTLTGEVASVIGQDLGHGWRAEYAVGLGVMVADAEIQLESDLIAVRSQSVLSEPYATLGVRVQQERGLFLTGDMRVFDDATSEFRSGIGWAF